ncbi:MAG: hypothetical protein ACRDK3_17725 [Actinomycetota bacterium]
MEATDDSWQSLEAERMLGLIADRDRLRVFSALALGASSTTDIRALTALDARTIEKALARLVAGELVVREPNGVVRILTEELMTVARSIGEKRRAEDPNGDVPGAMVLARFLRADG